jgi:K+-transporting ATPase ATPase A chain
MTNDLTQYAFFILVLVGAIVPVGILLARTFMGASHTRLERLTYRVIGVDPEEKMSWARYGMVLVLLNGAMMGLGYLILRLQDWLPFDSLSRSAQTADLAFNTAASFVTNTNWQSYSGETSLSNFSQMAVITFLMIVSAVTGVAAAGGFMRGLSRRNAGDIGSFWVDFTRVLYRVLLPLSFVVALIYVWQGMPETLNSATNVTTLEGAQQQLVMGPVASLESIKHLGTNGGGFFGANAAHPYENPTPLTNFIHMLSMLLIPGALTFAFGTMIARRRQGWAFFAAFLVMFVGFLALVYGSEYAGNPLLANVGVDSAYSDTQPGNSLEGKEMRFGVGQTSLFVAVTTAGTTGSVNSMHDSLTPIGGLVPIAEMMLNDVFGGVGVGLVNLITYAILTVFLVGMMIGRTPEFLGKKIEAREMKLVVIALLMHPFSILGFTAVAAMLPSTLQSLNNMGPHGFSEVLYAYVSGTANNGSAFAGLNSNTPFFNTTIGFAMLIGRYLTLLPMLAVAGALAAKKTIPAGPGTMSTSSVLFTGLLIFVVLVVGGLTFMPALALGPIAEQLMLMAHQTF